MGRGLNLMLTCPEESWSARLWGIGRCWRAAGTAGLWSSAGRPQPLATGSRASCGGGRWCRRGTWGVLAWCLCGAQGEGTERREWPPTASSVRLSPRSLGRPQAFCLLSLGSPSFQSCLATVLGGAGASLCPAENSAQRSHPT